MAKKPANYIFPATVVKGERNYGVSFYDLPGCVAVGDTMDEALHLAKDGLALHLWGMEQDGETIPEPTPLDDITVESGKTLCLLEANMFDIRSQMDNRPIKKTLTIPWYLNDLAEKRRINFSQVLQSALRERLSAR